MALVSRIEWISKSKAKIYLDEEVAFILTASDIKAWQLKEGTMLSDSEYKDIYDNLLLNRAKMKALDLLKAKDYTEWELHSRLKRIFYSIELADSAVEYVKGYHYVDDIRYTEIYVRYHSNLLSRRELISKLRGKGIKNDIIEQVLATVDIDDSSKLFGLIQKKYPDINQLSPEKQRKAINFLLRKGYTYEDIRSALREYDCCFTDM